MLMVVGSHHHFDHIGDMTTFPRSTEIVVGPGFKDAFVSAGLNPTNPEGLLQESHLE